MASQNPKRSKSSVYFQSVTGPEPSSRPVEALVTDTNHHTGEDHFPGYEEIYRIFNSVYFPMDDEDLEVYQNILKSGIHLVVSHHNSSHTMRQHNGASDSLMPLQRTS
jgi:hypothetical protein